VQEEEAAVPPRRRALTPKLWAVAIVVAFGVAASAAWVIRRPRVVEPVVVAAPIVDTNVEAATMLERGRHFFQLKIYGVAGAEARACLQIEANNAGCLRLLAEIFEKTGHGEEAATWYQRYLSVSPGAADSEQVRLKVFELLHPR
jgi:Tfp pilus assembly protein PilF